MLAYLPREIKDQIYSYVGHDLTWSELRADMHMYSEYCDLYIADNAKHRRCVKYYAQNEMWASLQAVSQYWKREGRELCEIIIARALKLQIQCPLRLPRGVHFNEKFD